MSDPRAQCSLEAPALAQRLGGVGETAVYDDSMSEWVRAGLPLTECASP